MFIKKFFVLFIFLIPILGVGCSGYTDELEKDFILLEEQIGLDDNKAKIEKSNVVDDIQEDKTKSNKIIHVITDMDIPMGGGVKSIEFIDTEPSL